MRVGSRVCHYGDSSLQIWPHFPALVPHERHEVRGAGHRADLSSRNVESNPERKRRLLKRRNTMRKYLLALALLSVSLSNAALAQQAPARSGTDEEQKACTRDVQKLCRPVIDQGDFTILACLRDNRAKLSAACAQVLKNHNQ
jgi:hypothetical protein